ncbi:hypothetical protein BGX34_006482 [Mortierella sp. NVP85]|nr:hypothetical protein BGX34_006482 [Mortierella sp. NVP85]
MKNLPLFLVIGAALQLTVQGAAPAADAGVCNTQECIQEAKNILSDLKPNVDPCVDFEQFACGGFFERETIPEDGWRYSYMEKMNAKNKQLVRQLVTAGDPQSPKPIRGDKVSARNIQRMQGFYASCTDDKQITKVGREPLVRQLEEVAHLYPVAESPIQHVKADVAAEKKDALSTAAGKLLRNDLRTFVNYAVYPDMYDPTRNVLYIDAGSVGLPTEDYTNANATKPYEQRIGELFYIFYAKEDPTAGKGADVKLEVPKVWKDVAKEVLAFETAFAGVIAPTEVEFTPEKHFNLLTASDLAKRAPSLDLNLVLKNALPKGVKVPKEMVVASPEYFNNLNKLLETTEPKTIQLYLAWSTIRKYSDLLDAAHRRPIDAKPVDRNKVCADNALRALPDIVSHYFVKAIFPERARAEVEEIINAIRSIYSKSFQSYNWLDSYTRKGAIEKMKNFVQKIGYSSSGPDDSSPSSIDRFYKGLKVDGQDYFGNQVRANAFWAQVEFGKLNKKVDRMHMDMSSPIVNAYYNPQGNDINFPAGILQTPFFHIDHPEYLNFGSFGTVAGHEITHGFDDEGRKWDGIGRYKNWWSNSSVEAFNTRANCFVEQYSKYSVPGPDGKEHPVSGQLTLGENIADNGGIKKAFESWLERYRSDPRGKKYNNKRLPGLEKYTPEQLFFIQYGRSWCNKNRPEAWKRLVTNVHSPPKWRIIGVVQNSEYFAKHFQCKAGTPMNPVKKCDLW